MAKMRARRAPLQIRRNGQLKSQVRFAFWMSGEPLTTTELMKKCGSACTRHAATWREILVCIKTLKRE